MSVEIKPLDDSGEAEANLSNVTGLGSSRAEAASDKGEWL